MRSSIPLVVLIALAGCQPEPEAAAPTSPASTAAPAPSPTAPTTAAPTGDPVAEMPEVTLSASGIILVNAVEGRGTATTLEFGRDKATVLDVMAVGFPAPRLSSNAECGAGAMEFAAWGPLTLNFQGGKLVGWRAEKGAQVVTVDGLQLGNTLAEIKSERSARRVPNSTLDGEFEYTSGDGGTIGGFLEGAGDAAKVASFHSGVNCFFR